MRLKDLRALAISVGCLLVVSCTSATRMPRTTSPPTQAALEWRPWGDGVFEAARTSGRLVLVDAGIEGCTACAWQHDRVYADAEVRALLSEHFVLVAVDADRQPDLGARFEPWGWPATVIFDAQGNTLRRTRGFVGADRFRAALAELAGAPLPEPALAVAVDGRDACLAAVAELERRRDADGWGPFVVDSPALLASFLSSSSEDTRWTDVEHAGALDERLLDPIWGGVFVGVRPDDRATPIFERRLLHEAAALTTFATLASATDDERWSRNAWEVHRYLAEVLREPDGLYASTQRDAPAGMDGAAYYALDDGARRAAGTPHVDHGSYTDQNARIASAFALLYRVTQDDRALSAARTVVDRILETRTRDDGGVSQAGQPPPPGERLRPALTDDRLFLRAQGPWGLALLALEEITSEPRYLDAAVRLALAADHLVRSDGSAMAAVPEAAGPGDSAASVAEVADLARFLAHLGARTHDDARVEQGRRLLSHLDARAVTGAGTPGLGAYLLAQAETALGLVDVTLVGAPGSLPALRTAALRAAGPGAFVHYEPAAPQGRYPSEGAAYVCSRVACSSAIDDPDRLRHAITSAAAIDPSASACGP